MPALTAQHLRKSFGPQVVLEDASFTLGRGEKVALIGANGAGKSTLARILAGLESPDGGAVSVRRGLAVRYLAQEPTLDPNASARDVVEDALTAWREATRRHAEVTAELDTLGLGAAAPGATQRADALVHEQAELGETVQRLGGWDRAHEAVDFLQRLGIRDVDRPCGPRSGGERRRIALAQLLVASPDVAVLDEPTNHLDAETAEWLESYLAREFPGAIVLVTHDRYFLDAIAERIVELERGRLTSYPGGYGDYLDKKAELMAHEGRVEQNRQNILRREREWLSRGPKARATKQKARIQRAAALEAKGSATAGRPGDVSLVAAATGHQGKTILELHGTALAVAEGHKPLTAPMDLRLTTGERVGIVGPNGIGKTTLIRAILAAASEARTGVRPEGAPIVTSGTLVVGKNTRVSYLDQGRAKLDDSKSIFDDVRGEGGGTVVQLGVRGHESMELRSYLELFLFDASKQRQKVGSLSGGERARVALAKVLREGANLLVFDEPTNDLDLPTLSALEGLLEAFTGSVLVVTHDRAFLDGVATSILAFERDPTGRSLATVTKYAGGYQDYVSQRASRAGAPAPSARATALPAPSPPSTKKPQPVAASGSLPKAKGKSTLTYAERLELETIVEAIEAAEAKVADIERQLADPSLYAAGSAPEVDALKSTQREARAKAAALAVRWELLESKREGAA